MHLLTFHSFSALATATAESCSFKTTQGGGIAYIFWTSFPSKHKTFVEHLFNVDPTSSTLVQHCINVIQMFCVYWDAVCSSALQMQTVFLGNAELRDDGDDLWTRQSSYWSDRPACVGGETLQTDRPDVGQVLKRRKCVPCLSGGSRGKTDG